jgi:hypothetical protein
MNIAFFLGTIVGTVIIFFALVASIKDYDNDDWKINKGF